MVKLLQTVNIINTELVTLTQARAQMITDAMRAGKIGYVMHMLTDLSAADVADIFNILDQGVREQLVEKAIKSLDPEFLLDLDDNIREQLFKKITTVGLAEALSHMDTKDAISIIEDMSAEQQKLLFGSLNPAARVLIEAGLSYPGDSVGRIAETRPPTAPSTWTVKQMRAVLSAWDLDSKPSYIILLDKHGKPESALHIAQLACSNDPSLTLDSMPTEELFKMPYSTDKEDAAFAFRRHKLELAVVVDDMERLLGILTPESLLQVEHEEAEEDLMRITGTEGLDDGVSRVSVIMSRVRWIIPTICFSCISSFVVEGFAELISRNAMLLVIAPMLAAIGGAVLTQTVGATVRLLSDRRLSILNIGLRVRREMAVCLGMGFVIAAMLVLRYVLTRGIDENFLLMLCVAGGASLCVMLWASVVGVLMPFFTARIGLDPIASVGSTLPATADIIANLSWFYLAWRVLG